MKYTSVREYLEAMVEFHTRQARDEMQRADQAEGELRTALREHAKFNEGRAKAAEEITKMIIG